MDITGFICSCSACACNKYSHLPHLAQSSQYRSNLNRGLTFPQKFITALHMTQGNSVILAVVDRFSKLAHFVALPKFPSALETTQLLITPILRLHGIPVDLVSDQSPQLISRVWKQYAGSWELW